MTSKTWLGSPNAPKTTANVPGDIERCSSKGLATKMKFSNKWNRDANVRHPSSLRHIQHPASVQTWHEPSQSDWDLNQGIVFSCFFVFSNKFLLRQSRPRFDIYIYHWYILIWLWECNMVLFPLNVLKMHCYNFTRYIRTLKFTSTIFQTSWRHKWLS